MLVGSDPTLGAVMEHTRIGLTPRDRLMQVAQNEMSKFERREFEFRKRDREERAAELLTLRSTTERVAQDNVGSTSRLHTPGAR